MSRLRKLKRVIEDLLLFPYEIRRRQRIESRPSISLDEWFNKYATQWRVEREIIQSNLSWLAFQIGVEPGQLLPEDSFDNVLSAHPEEPIDDGLSMAFGFAERELHEFGMFVELRSIEDYLKLYGTFLMRKQG